MEDLSKAELVTYGVLCAVAAAVIIPSLKLGLGEKGELGPGFLPFVASLCILVAVIVAVILNLIKKKKGVLPTETEKIDRKGWLRVLGIMINFALWPILAGVIGYIMTSFLVSLGIAKSIGYKGFRGPIVLSISVAICIWFIFGFFFQLDLPAGFSF
jgi:hypothetical protein